MKNFERLNPEELQVIKGGDKNKDPNSTWCINCVAKSCSPCFPEFHY